jgi:protein CpxP
MKKLMMICALLFSVITYASAQQAGGRMGGTPEERAKRNTDQLAEKLKLTEDQKTKVLAIYTEQNAAMAKAREAGEGMDREKMTKMMTDTNTKVEALLNDEQKTAFKAYLEERRKQMEARQNGGGK